MVKCSQINGTYSKTNCFITCEVIATITRTRDQCQWQEENPIFAGQKYLGWYTT